MTLSGSGSKTMKKRLLPYIFFSMVVAVYLLLCIVVTMLVTGSVHVINTRFIHFGKINIVTVIIAATIIIVSLIFFIRNIRKIFRFIEEQVTYRV